MKIIKYKITDKIYLLIFSNQYDITSTFLRFQEYYESPKFRGKIFSLDEFKKWEAKKNGKFTYYKDWNGFNIPSYVLKPFNKGRFNPLSIKEKQFLNLFKNKKNKFYIIEIHKKSKNIKNVLKHEIAHGLFYTAPQYRKEVLKILNKFNLKNVKNKLIKKGYCKSVLNDEVQAYALAPSKKIKTQHKLTESLEKIYNKYSRSINQIY